MNHEAVLTVAGLPLTGGFGKARHSMSAVDIYLQQAITNTHYAEKQHK